MTEDNKNNKQNIKHVEFRSEIKSRVVNSIVKTPTFVDITSEIKLDNEGKEFKEHIEILKNDDYGNPSFKIHRVYSK